MLTRIPELNYERCYPRRLKKFFRANINYNTYNDVIPHVERAVVGNLPPEIIKLFKSNKGEKIKAFQNALVDIVNYLRTCYKNAQDQNLIFCDFKDLDEDDLKLLEQSMSLFAKDKMINLLPKNVHPEIKYVGRGVRKNVFKFSLKNKDGENIIKDKALAVYKKIICPYPKISNQQNNFAEANFWTYIKYAAGHKLDKTQFTRHYISDLKNGYAMTEYIDKDIQKTTAPLNLSKLFGIEYKDISNKPINDKYYDAGGFLKTSYFKEDKLIMRFFKKLWFRNSEEELNKVISDFEFKISNPKTPHRDKIQKALVLFKQIKGIHD